MKKEPLEGRELIDFCAKILFDRRTEDVQLIDLDGNSDIADYFLLGTCTSEAQMKAIIATLTKELRRAGVKPLGVEYKSGVRWAVLDLGETMVHLFEEEARGHYDLEKLWSDGKLEKLKEEDYIIEEEIVEDDNEFL